MKTRIYLRIGKGKKGNIRLAATQKPAYAPLESGYNNPIPTVSIALDIEIPDKEFDASRILLEAKLQETKPAVEIKQVMTK